MLGLLGFNRRLQRGHCGVDCDAQILTPLDGMAVEPQIIARLAVQSTKARIDHRLRYSHGAPPFAYGSWKGIGQNGDVERIEPMFLVSDHVFMSAEQSMYIQSCHLVMERSIKMHSRATAERDIDIWFSTCDQVAMQVGAYNFVLDELDGNAPHD